MVSDPNGTKIRPIWGEDCREAATGLSPGLLRYATARPSLAVGLAEITGRDVGPAEPGF
jgi:hypothetical protein